MKRLRTILVLCFVSLGLNLSHPAQAQVGPASLIVVSQALQQLKQTLESTVNTVDAESAARIHQLELVLDKTIAEVSQAITDASHQVQYDENKVFADVFTTMSTVNSELTSKGYLAYVGVNASLSNLATVMEGLPLVKVGTFLYATYPLRLSPQATDTLISFFGHYPDVDDSHPATVKYAVDGQPEQTANLKRNVGGSLGLVLPTSYLKQGKFVNFTIAVPKKTFLVFHTADTFDTRVYVENIHVLEMKIDIYQENPKLWVTLQSPREHVERADSTRTSNTGSLSAADLFSTLINDNATYDASTATFAFMEHQENASGSPCWCNCSGASASLTNWNSNAVSWTSNAPSCGPQACTKGGGFLGAPQFQACGGGGTHAEVHLKPVFKVKLRGQPDDALLTTQEASMARRDVWTGSQLAAGWTNVSVTGRFSDGDEKNTCKLVVSKGVPNGSCPLFKADVTGNVVTIQSN